MSRLNKALRVLTSDLALPDRLRYLRDAARRSPAPGYCFRGGGHIRLRPSSTDARVFDEVFIERVYDALLPAAGVSTIIDLGANIGLSTIALLRAYPHARAVAVEPDAANFAAMIDNLHAAGLADRCLPVLGFAGAEPGFADLEDSGNGAWGLRMGRRSSAGTPVYTVAGLASRAGMTTVSLVKCDIEGSERDLFASIAAWEHLVRYMILELHADLYPVASFEAALASSGYDWTLHGRISEHSPLSVIAIERGSPRPQRLTAQAL